MGGRKDNGGGRARVVVCHPGKQHVNALLAGLEGRGSLVRFYTMFAANKFWAIRFFPENWRAMFLKYAFRDIDGARIAHAPVLFFLSKFIGREIWTIRGPYFLFDKWVAWRLGQEAAFDIVIGYETANLNIFRAAKRQGRVTVLDLAGVHHHFQNPILAEAGVYTDPGEVAFISRKKDEALAVTDYVLALSALGERALLGAGIARDRIFRTYLGVDLRVFSPKSGYRLDDGGRLELYFVGTLSRRKGLPFAVSLMEELRRRGLPVHLTLVGPVDDFDPRSLDGALFTHIPFMGHGELAALHHRLDLFVFPSNMDSWAQTVVEAMACGSPVLVSANTGARDAVEQGGGLVLPVGDLGAWADAIGAFCADRLLLKEMGEKGAAVAQQYTWDEYQRQVSAAMEEILARAGRKP